MHMRHSAKGGAKKSVQVYMDIKIGPRFAGRMVFELFTEQTPRTAENFRALCTGERGISPLSGHPLHYKGSIFHRVIKGFMAQGGDFTAGDGTGGESVYGLKFADEAFTYQHASRGTLSMANAGPDTNGSQFFLTFRDTPHLDGKHVVFGRLLEGMEVLQVVEMVATDGRDRPRMPMTVVDCGQIGETAEEDEGDEGEGGEEAEGLEMGDKPEEGRQGKGVKKVQGEEDSGEEEEKEEERIREDEEAEEGEEGEKEVDMSGMTETQRRLYKLKWKLNQGRKLNRQAVKEEFTRKKTPNLEARLRAEERRDSNERWRKEILARGMKPEEAYMFETAEAAGKKQAAAARKAKGQAAFGWDVFNQDALYKAYKKRLGKLPSAEGGARGEEEKEGRGEEPDPLAYGQAPRGEAAGLVRMTEELEERERARKNFSRRRAAYEGEDVSSINERNKMFNKKLKRAYDKYTVETRQNLERGTAM